MGVEPLWGHWYHGRPGELLPVLPMRVERCGAFKNHAWLIIIARPDHGGWTEWAVSNAHPGSEILYIGKPANVPIDLPDVPVEVVGAPPCPEEQVYRVRRQRGRILGQGRRVAGDLAGRHGPHGARPLYPSRSDQ